MLITTTDALPGMTVAAVKGLVMGNTIRSRAVGRDIAAGLRSVFGGEITEYTRLMNESRAEAMQRMVADAEALGANAILGLRFTTSTVMAGAAELLAYGTAVVLAPDA